MAPLHCRTWIQTRTRIPYAAIGDWDPSPDLCNVKIQHITIVAKGKTLRIRVRQCKRAIIEKIFGYCSEILRIHFLIIAFFF